MGSVDYGVHLGHAYNDSNGATRYLKVNDALTNLGVSVIGGAVTTIGAGLTLFLCNFAFFQEFGAFLCVTSFSSLIYSFFFLMPLLMVIGPEGEMGQFTTLFKRCIKQPSSTAGTTASAPSPSHAWTTSTKQQE